MNNWFKELPFAITISDINGNILDMNEKSKSTFEKWGSNLIGQSLFDCHSPESQKKISELYQNQSINAYTIEKNGIKKLIYQAPWYENEKFMGYIELSLIIPVDMPHFVRK